MKLKKITLITIHPDFIKSYTDFGPLANCLRKNLLELQIINLRDFAVDKHGTVDGKPFGGDDGMVLRPEPLAAALKAAGKGHVILTCPQGDTWKQSTAEGFVAKQEHLIIICGRFSGVDQRVKDLFVNQEISCGDFILSGGELPALLITDTISRLLPEALGNELSSRNDSFSSTYNGLLEHPLYTKPRVFKDLEVPSVLVSGNHGDIAQWQAEQRRKQTAQKRKDLLL